MTERKNISGRTGNETSLRVGRIMVYITRWPEERYLPMCGVTESKDFGLGGDGPKGPLPTRVRALYLWITSDSIYT
jgi:hypothetical protein